MNANELADLVECACCAYQKEAAAMLRQFGLAESIIKQQELRIAELEAKIDEMAGEIMSLENSMGAMTGYGHN
jgi:polysaccharide pyruvyl transferase WcaK-like protein